MKHLLSINEMFDRILETDYEIIPESKSDSQGLHVIFNTLKYSYRLDIVPDYEFGKGRDF